MQNETLDRTTNDGCMDFNPKPFEILPSVDALVTHLTALDRNVKLCRGRGASRFVRVKHDYRIPNPADGGATVLNIPTGSVLLEMDTGEGGKVWQLIPGARFNEYFYEIGAGPDALISDVRSVRSVGATSVGATSVGLPVAERMWDVLSKLFPGFTLKQVEECVNQVAIQFVDEIERRDLTQRSLAKELEVTRPIMSTLQTLDAQLTAYHHMHPGLAQHRG